jgi:hypothetical protein
LYYVYCPTFSAPWPSASVGISKASWQLLHLTLRREALRVPMQQLIDGRQPALLICPTCRLTVRALARDYRFAVTGGRVASVPLKNWASHLVEAHQYALMDGGAFHEIQARRTARQEQAAPRVAPAFNPFRRSSHG